MSSLFEDAEERRSREHIARALGISLDELDEHPYNIEENSSDDGLVYSWRIFWEVSPPEGVSAFGPEGGQWTDVAVQHDEDEYDCADASRENVEEIPFNDPSSNSYMLFSDALEEDDLVFFHATHEGNLSSILNYGFKSSWQLSGAGLKSVSFSKKSAMALSHAIYKRNTLPGEYIVFAVKYDRVDRAGIELKISDLHDFTLNPPPKIIAFCRIPSNYLFL